MAECFKKYPQIVNFSGHSHYSLIDERSIYQKDYTAIQTQSLSYIELENGKYNGTVPKDIYDNYDENGITKISTANSMGLICDVNEKAVVIKRISFEKEEFYGNDWIIDIPINKNSFRYIYEKMDKNSVKPYFKFENNDDKKVFIETNNNNINIIKFRQAYHPNFIHSYKIILKNEDGKGKDCENLYFSDFYLMPSDRKDIISFRLKGDQLKGEYNIKIYAYDSFGKESDNYIEDNIVIGKKKLRDSKKEIQTKSKNDFNDMKLKNQSKTEINDKNLSEFSNQENTSIYFSYNIINTEGEGEREGDINKKQSEKNSEKIIEESDDISLPKELKKYGIFMKILTLKDPDKMDIILDNIKRKNQSLLNIIKENKNNFIKFVEKPINEEDLEFYKKNRNEARELIKVENDKGKIEILLTEKENALFDVLMKIGKCSLEDAVVAYIVNDKDEKETQKYLTKKKGK